VVRKRIPSDGPCDLELALDVAIERSHDANLGKHRGPPCSTTSIIASMAACHSGRVASFFGSAVTQVAASRSLTAGRPATRSARRTHGSSLYALTSLTPGISNRNQRNRATGCRFIPRLGLDVQLTAHPVRHRASPLLPSPEPPRPRNVRPNLPAPTPARSILSPRRHATRSGRPRPSPALGARPTL
jgi:hypothetical protein